MKKTKILIKRQQQYGLETYVVFISDVLAHTALSEAGAISYVKKHWPYVSFA